MTVTLTDPQSAAALKAAQRQLERMLDDEELRFCSETGATLEQIISNIHHALIYLLQPAPTINPSEIKIYAVHDATDPDHAVSLYGYSFSAEPGNAEPHHRHQPIDPLNPGASLHLYCFKTPEQASAFIGGLQLSRADACGQTMQTFAPDLTAVLIEFYDSAANHLIINTDHLVSAPSAPADDQYIVLVQSVADPETRRFLHFSADDPQHAQEQALDEDPNNTVTAVFHRIQ